ncbi:MAG: sugar nucleotide-binding protein [Planctomycetaceae bacterium]|nr:sugar nucleotide-binding protein [Planctomycetaceae bacterium]
MQKLLIVGVDTVAGANLAASLSDRYQVFTAAPDRRYEIPNCDALDPADAPRRYVELSQADVIILCGPAARSNWEPSAKEGIQDSTVESTQEWAKIARETDAKLVMVSSDAVFSGPWMFHDEQSPGFSQSYQAQVIRAAEDQVTRTCTNSLVLRTNVFGWSPQGESGWLETMLSEISARRVVEQDYIRHATPMLATDLAEIIDRACQENLTGTYHVGGAERISPLTLAQRLADTFDLPWLSLRKEAALTETPQGFGASECSLQTKAIRKELCVAMPLLSESLERLKEQSDNGYRARLASTNATPKRRAA